MPFYLGDPKSQGNKLSLCWDPAYDFDGEFIRYDVQVATDWTFEKGTIVTESLGQLACEAIFELPEPGAPSPTTRAAIRRLLLTRYRRRRALTAEWAASQWGRRGA